MYGWRQGGIKGVLGAVVASGFGCWGVLCAPAAGRAAAALLLPAAAAQLPAAKYELAALAAASPRGGRGGGGGGAPALQPTARSVQEHYWVGLFCLLPFCRAHPHPACSL